MSRKVALPVTFSTSPLVEHRVFTDAPKGNRVTAKFPAKRTKLSSEMHIYIGANGLG